MGYAGTTQAAIAAHAGVSRPAVKYHFRTKLALFGSVVEHDTAVLDAALVVASGEPTLRRRLRSFLTATETDAQVGAATAFLLAAGMERRRHPTLLQARPDPCDGLHRFLARSVSAAVGNGELRADIPASAVVDTFYAVISGLALFDGAFKVGSDTRVETVMRLLTSDVVNDPDRRATTVASCVA